MKHVGLNEVTAQLSTLLDDVARGEEVTIVRDGLPVARLVPITEKPAVVSDYSPEEIEIRRAALKRIRNNAREIGLRASQEEIKSWIEEGRH